MSGAALVRAGPRECVPDRALNAWLRRAANAPKIGPRNVRTRRVHA